MDDIEYAISCLETGKRSESGARAVRDQADLLEKYRDLVIERMGYDGPMPEDEDYDA